jgi:hypothetical protein
MGTLFATPGFIERYLKVGIEEHIPVMLPAGNDKMIQAQLRFLKIDLQKVQAQGKMLWDAGLPVLDDLDNNSYDWQIPDSAKNDDVKLQHFKTARYIADLKQLQPGVTMIIMHCTATSPQFKYITGSGDVRRGDLLAMLDPAFKKALENEHIILTTWRELMQRRTKAGN